MTVGKPNFNLNSFGIKYLSKEEVQELLNKTQEGDSEQVVDSPKAPRLELGRITDKPQKVGSKDLTPKRNPESAFYEPKDPEGGSVTSSTRSTFNSKEPPAKNRSLTERKLRRDVVESGGKVDDSNIVTQKIKPQHTGNPSHGTLERKREDLGSTVGFNSQGNVPSKDKDGNKRSVNPRDHVRNTDGVKEKKQYGDKRPRGSNLPSHVGDAPKDVDSKTEKIGASNVKVGVGEKANERLQENNIGELTDSQKPYEKKEPKGLNSMSDTSSRSKKHDARGKKYKWQDEKSKKAYGKLKDRESQAKFLDAQDKKYKQSVSTPKTISPAGKKLADMVGKSSDIVMDMNIMKLNLMKDGIEGGGKNTPEFGKTGHMGMNRQPQHKEGQAVEARSVSDKRELPYEQRPRMNVFDKKPKGKPPVKKPYNNNQPDSRIPEKELNETERNRIITTGLGDASEPNAENSFIGGHGAPKDLKTKADETLFKVISLKLDLMKRDGEKIGTGEKDTRQMTDRFNEEYNLPDTVAGKKTKRMLDDHVSPVDN